MTAKGESGSRDMLFLHNIISKQDDYWLNLFRFLLIQDTCNTAVAEAVGDDAVEKSRIMRHGSEDISFKARGHDVFKYPRDVDLLARHNYAEPLSRELKEMAELPENFAEFGYGVSKDAHKKLRSDQQFRAGKEYRAIFIARLIPHEVSILADDHERVMIGNDYFALKEITKNGKFAPDIVEKFRKLYSGEGGNISEDDKGLLAKYAPLLECTEDSIPIVLSVECKMDAPKLVLLPEHDVTEDVDYSNTLARQHPLLEGVKKFFFLLERQNQTDSSKYTAGLLDFLLRYKQLKETYGNNTDEYLSRLAVIMAPAQSAFHRAASVKEYLPETIGNLPAHAIRDLTKHYSHTYRYASDPAPANTMRTLEQEILQATSKFDYENAVEYLQMAKQKHGEIQKHFFTEQLKNAYLAFETIFHRFRNDYNQQSAYLEAAKFNAAPDSSISFLAAPLTQVITTPRTHTFYLDTFRRRDDEDYDSTKYKMDMPEFMQRVQSHIVEAKEIAKDLQAIQR